MNLIRHSVLLLAATQIANLSNLLFHSIMGRNLDTSEYGVMVTMLNVTLITSTPMEAVRASVAHFSARLLEQSDRSEIKSLVIQWYKRLSWFVLPVVIGALVFVDPLATFFRIERVWPIRITAIIIIATLYVPVLSGAFQGIQMFRWLAVMGCGWSVLRVLFGWFFIVVFSTSAVWGLLGQALGLIISFIVGTVVLWKWIGNDVPRQMNRSWREQAYFGRALAALLGFSILMNSDMIFIKHFFSPEEAGLYAKAGIIGRTIVFLPMPIAMALFPKVVSAGHTTTYHWKALLQSVLFAGVIIMSAVGGCLLLPWIPLSILFGEERSNIELIRMLRVVVLVMSPLGMTFLLTNFELAQHRFFPSVLLPIAAIGYVIGVCIWHQHIWEVLYVMGGVSFCSMLGLIVAILWQNKHREH